MAYADLDGIQTPSTGAAISPAWGLQVRDNLDAVANPPRARVGASANQAINDSVDTAIVFDTVQHDSHGLFDPGAPTRLTVPAGWDGLYVMQASIAWGASTVGRRRIRFRLNGSVIIDGIEGPPNGATGSAPPGGSAQKLTSEYELAAGDYIEFVVNQTTGGNLDCIAQAPAFPNFTMRWQAVLAS